MKPQVYYLQLIVVHEIKTYSTFTTLKEEGIMWKGKRVWEYNPEPVSLLKLMLMSNQELLFCLTLVQ